MDFGRQERSPIHQSQQYAMLPQTGNSIPQREQIPHMNAPMAERPPIGMRPGQPPYTHSQAVSSRIASANAAIAAIQSVNPANVAPVPRNRPIMVNVGLPQLPGGDLKGTIKYDHSAGTEVVNERTAQQSASEFTTFLSKVRSERMESWDSFWNHRLELNREILLNENECFKSAQEDSADYDDSDDDGGVKKGRPIAVPYMYTNVGSFDIPPPKPVLMPDPELVTRSNPQFYMAEQAQAPMTAQQQAAAQQQILQQQQYQQAMAMSARQRASQQVRNRF